MNSAALAQAQQAAYTVLDVASGATSLQVNDGLANIELNPSASVSIATINSTGRSGRTLTFRGTSDTNVVTFIATGNINIPDASASLGAGDTIVLKQNNAETWDVIGGSAAVAGGGGGDSIGNIAITNATTTLVVTDIADTFTVTRTGAGVPADIDAITATLRPGREITLIGTSDTLYAQFAVSSTIKIGASVRVIQQYDVLKLSQLASGVWVETGYNGPVA